MGKLEVRKKKLRGDGVGGTIFDHNFYLDYSVISEMEAMASEIAYKIGKPRSKVLEWDTEDIKFHFAKMTEEAKESKSGGSIDGGANPRAHD